MQKIICFHNPEEENGWLSNWFLSKFIVDNTVFFINGTVYDV